MTDTPSDIKIGRLARDHAGVQIVVKRDADTGPVRLSFPLSSEAPVERWFGTEVLSHATKAVRMDRLAAGAAPLLFNHDWGDPVGMIDGARLEDGRLVVDAHLFDTERAREVAKMIDGGLRNVSIGYEILEMTEDSKRNTYTATQWMPLEGSIVTVPADVSVGIGRQADDQAKPVRVLRAQPIQQPAAPAAPTGEAMSADTIATPAGASADTRSASPSITVVADHSNRPDAATLEQQRQRAIRNLAAGAQCDDRYVQHWITSGAALEKVADDILAIQSERSKPGNMPTFLDMSAKEVQRYSLMRALRAATSKDWTKAGLELEANRELSKRMSRLPRADTSFFVPLDKLMQGRRDMTVAGVSGSNYLVGTDNMAGSFIDLLRNDSVTLRMGVSRMAGLVGNVTIPRMTAGGTAYWLADESTQITESQPTIGQVSLSPKNVAALTELSHQLMQQSSPDVEQLVLSSIARDIALAVDVGVIRGSGNSGQPQGIVGTNGVGSVTGGSLDAADVVEFMSDVAGSNALRDTSGYVTTPAVAALLMVRPELPSTGTTRLWTGNMLNGQLFGHRAMATNQMASATMLFGDWSTVILAEWGVLELMVNPFSDFTRGLSQVRGWYTCDVAMRYPGAFSYASSIT
ncbi:MAG: phage major capsid protein [Rubrivivax sp.]|nr:phage major capsid protein [Rubrivivax sp.]